MSFGIVMISTIIAYLTGFASLLMGNGFLASLGVIAATGVGVALGLAALLFLRGAPTPASVPAARRMKPWHAA